jgi:23S rRNA pseudouridine1911/1915/1917 synthase
MRAQVEDTPERRHARLTLARHGVRVLYEDNHLLGLAKPAGLLSQGGPAGVVALTDLIDAYRHEAEGKPGRAYVGLVHRLDRNVSGAMVVAKTSKAAARLSAAFRERPAALVKLYLAWVEGVPAAPVGELVHRLRREGGVTRPAADGDGDGREARLRYRVVGRGRRCARMEVRLHTGLPHQIRAQLALLGHPLRGDRKYGGGPWRRPALHAVRLTVPHPVDGAPVTLEAPVPAPLRDLDTRLGLRPPVGEAGDPATPWE